MLALDSEALLCRQSERDIDDTQEKVAAWIADQTRMSEFNGDERTSPLNAARKLGKIMYARDFETRLHKLNSNLVFKWGLVRNTHKWMCIPDPTISDPSEPYPGLRTILVYSSTVLPERTMWSKRTLMLPDPRYSPKPGDVDWKDWEWVPLPGYEKGHRSDGWRHAATMAKGKWQRKDPTAPRAGWTNHVTAWGEAQRGWRTCLIMLVKEGLLTINQVEQEFFADDTPEWARHTGRQAIYLPW